MKLRHRDDGLFADDGEFEYELGMDTKWSFVVTKRTVGHSKVVWKKTRSEIARKFKEAYEPEEWFIGGILWFNSELRKSGLKVS